MANDTNERRAACSCGSLSARVRGEPLRVSVCHCSACQRRTGSVFGVQARFPARAVVIEGPSNSFLRTGDSGAKITCYFCPECGARVYYVMAALPEVIGIPVGAFADPKFPSPRVSVYEASKHGWVRLPADVEAST